MPENQNSFPTSMLEYMVGSHPTRPTWLVMSLQYNYVVQDSDLYIFAVREYIFLQSIKKTPSILITYYLPKLPSY